MSAYSLCLTAVLLLAAAFEGYAQTALSDWTPGVATNYGGSASGMDPNQASYGLSNGACGYGNLPASSYPFFSAVGIPTNSDIKSFPTGGCGTCIEFECVNNRTPDYAGRCGAAGSTVTVTVTDVCPECSDPEAGSGDHFDLNALAYNQISPMISGRIDVNYRIVACTPPSALKVTVDGNDGVGLWLRLVITTVADLGTISAVNIAGPDGAYRPMTNTYGAAWEVPNQPAYPISLEVTSGSQTVALTNVLAAPTTGTFQTNQQFSTSGSSSTSTVTTPTGSSSSSASSSASSSSSTTTSTPATNPPASPGTTPPATPPATPAASPGGCTDIPPKGSAFTCPQQAAYGQCGATWMQGFCHQSCHSC